MYPDRPSNRSVELIFWLLFGILFWCFAGYPASMRIRALLRKPRASPSRDVREARVSVVLAVRNGEKLLERRIRNLLDQDYPHTLLEVVVVCNGCTDGTVALAESIAGREPRVRVRVSAAEEGKAGALNLGAEVASGEILVFADVRQRFAPEAIRRLVAEFEDASVGAVSGRLVIEGSDRSAAEGMRRYWEMEIRLRLDESRTGSVVGATGAIYAVRRDRYEPIPPNTILDDVWLPMRIAAGGNRVVMTADALAFDVPMHRSHEEFYRRRRTMIGNLQLVRVLPGVLNPRRNPLFFRFVSHKLLRLMAPVCLLGMVLTAFTIPGPFYQAVAIGGLAAYALGLMGLVFRIPGTSIATAAVLMQAAILSAFFRYREDASSAWSGSALGEPSVAVAGSAGIGEEVGR
jgi:poly-beta-1,6-N-acetyl-D-glucosamine synthase